MKLKKIGILLLAAFMLLAVGCKEKDGSGALFRYSLLGEPKNLDPQLAADTSSLIIINNMFDGLLRIGSDGKLTAGAATDYSVSEDGLTYTFSLKEDMLWYSDNEDFSEPVTAKDFVFAFRRIFDKRTGSPYASEFLCLENAEILNGEAEYDQIGVFAPDDYTVIFKLSYPNANFLTLLTTPPAMPCNEKFFYSTGGKYGLESESTISNGPFYLKYWQYDPYGKDNYLILRKNTNFSSKETVYPSSLNFFVETDSEKIKADFFDKNTDCFVSSGEDKKIFSSSYETTEYESLSYGLIFNLEDEKLSNYQLRKGLCLTFDRSGYQEVLGDSSRTAYAIVPSGVTLLNKSYRELVAEEGKGQFLPDEGKEAFKAGNTELGQFSLEGVKILVPESYQNIDYIKALTQQWQKNLSFYCGVEQVSDGEYQSRLESGEYQIAILCLSGDFNSPASVLEAFATGGRKNYSGYSNPAVDELLEKSKHVKTMSECVQLYHQAESAVLSDFAYLPLYYQKQYLVYKKTISDIQFNPFTGQIYFKDAEKL